MSLDRDSSIIAQNAGTIAANIYGSLVAQRGDTSFDPEEYEAIRLHVFQGTLSLAGAETVVEVFEGAGYTAGAGVANDPGANKFRQAADAVPSGGGKPDGNFVVNFGKHRGKTLDAINAVDRGWLEWVARESNNEFVKGRVAKYLAA